tara:strand:- start:442 stop:1806 length:1365 start_codon:yes stop_codon:yes gene_type:complete
MAEKKQGINFYELGRKSGATTPKTQQSGFQTLVGSIDKTVGGMLNASKAATAALTAAMPSGVAIEKVPEQLRGQVSKYLADNKKEYTDAAAIVASGINPQSQRYKDAVEKMNSVNTKFENLSNNLEAIAIARKNALDNPEYSPATNNEDGLIYNNLANGSLYSTMSINNDGTFNYKDANGNNQLFSEFKVQKQGFTGQQGYLALVEDAQKQAGIKGMTFDALRGKYQTTIDTLFDKLGPRGSLDYAFADQDFLNQYLERPEIKSRYEGKDKEEFINNLKKNPGNFVEEYKKHNMTELEKAYKAAPKYEEPFKGTAGAYDSMQTVNRLSGEMKKLNKQEDTKKGAMGVVKGKKAEITQVRNYLKNDLTFIKNQMGIPKSAQIFIGPDSQTGGYSYYIKKNQLNPNTNEKEVVNHKIQDAMAPRYNSDRSAIEGYMREPLQFDNFRFILREYRIIQ